jgi:hypothetical protein
VSATSTLPRVEPFSWQSSTNRPYQDHARRRYANRPAAVHVSGAGDLVRTDNPRFLNYMRGMREGLRKHLPPSKAPGGIYDASGIAGGWERATCNLAGYSMDPGGIPMLNASRWAKRKSLRSAADEEVLALIATAMFAGVDEDVNVRFSDVSTTGFPYFSHERDMRMLEWTRGCELLPALAKAHAKRDPKMLRALAEEGVLAAAHTTYRSQPDGVTFEGGVYTGKLRNVQTYDLDWQDADKSTPYPDMKALRRRPNNGIAASVAYPLLGVFGQRRAAAKKHAFAVSYNSVTAKEVSRFASSYPALVGLDTKHFERTVTIDMMRVVFTAAGFSPTMCALLEAVQQCPVLLSEDRLERRGVKWSDDPRLPRAYTRDAGLPSGVPWTSDVGKAVGLMYAVVLLRDIGWNGDVGALLSREDPRFGVCSLGDDTIIGCARAEDAAAIRAYVAADKHPYAELSIEPGAKFAGLLIVRASDGSVACVPDLSSYIANWFAPERDLTSRARRETWHLGWYARETFFSAAPSYATVRQIRDEAWAAQFGAPPDAGVGSDAASLLLSEASRLYLEKPRGHHYGLYNLEDVDPALLTDTVTVPAALAAPKLRTMLEQMG